MVCRMEKWSGGYVWNLSSSGRWERCVREHQTGYESGGVSCVTLRRRGPDFEKEPQALDQHLCCI